MGKVSPITRYKRKLISSIVNSPDLISLIDNKYVVNGECVDVDAGLIHKQIFPHYYIPETQDEQLAYVMMKVNGLGIRNKMYNRVEVYIYVVSHQGIMQVVNGDGTRIDMMGEIVEELFNGRDDFGFGEMELVANYEDSINNLHRCRILRFTVEDFNSDACKDE